MSDQILTSTDKPTIDELMNRTTEKLIIFTNDLNIAEKRLKHIPVKLTTIETLLDVAKAASQDIKNDAKKTERIINNQTIVEIKADIEKAMSVLKNQYEIRNQAERKAVEFAIEKISSRNAGFAHEDLVTEALEHALKELMTIQNKKVTREDILRIIGEKQASGELVMGKYFDDGTKWTTKEALELERSIITHIKKGENKLDPLLEHKIVKDILNNTKLTDDQKNACSLIATTKDQYIIVQGYAGTGKTSIFPQVAAMLKEVAETKKIEMLAFAPTHKAVNELKSRGIKAQTLKSFLVDQQRKEKKQNEAEKQEDKNVNQETQKGRADKSSTLPKINSLDDKLIILDEASMVSNHDLLEFIKTVGISNSHIIPAGDKAQLPSVSSGKPFEMIQKSDILKTAFLKEIIRQKNPRLKEAVEMTIKHDYASAFEKITAENPQNYIERISPEQNKNDKDQNLYDLKFFKKLNKSIIEIDNNELKAGGRSLEEMLAEDYLTRTPEAREQTAVIVYANEDRAIINEYIRKGLKEQGEIKENGLKVACLTSKGFTDAEHKSLRSYVIGDVVKLGKKYYRILERDLEARSLLLQDGSYKTKYFYPEKEADKYNLELYAHSAKELAIGDKIRLTKTDKKRGLFANFEYRVKEINEIQVVLEPNESSSEQGNTKKQVIFNHGKLKNAHWDYSYTVTGYGIQGASEKNTINYEVSYRKCLANQRDFYIGASRAIEHSIVYTDNKDKFLRRVLGNTGDKYSALEVTGELDKQKQANDISLDKDITKEAKITQEIFDEKKINARYFNVKEINQLLENSAESFVERLLGRPNEKSSSATEWRYGNKGSLAIKMSGDKKGLWHNFETGESGNLITLLQKERGLTFPEALQYASDMFGGYQAMSSTISSAKNKNNSLNSIDNHNKKAKTNSPENKTSEYAHKLVAESKPIGGTIVEKYLKEIRGIKEIDSTDIRYHPKVYVGKSEKQKYLPAMLSIGRDKDGNIQCVQATYLDPKTANKADLTVKKRTYASPSGALVSLEQQELDYKTANNINDIRKDNKINKDNKNKISFIAEGTETGLSIKDAIRDIKNSEVVITLGKSNFASIDQQSVGKHVIFCLDNDGPKTFSDDMIHKAAKRLIDCGKEVFIALPEQINRNDNKKVDFNDLAKHGGISVVKNSLDHSIPYVEWKNLAEKNSNIHKAHELNLNIAEKIMPKDPYLMNRNLYDSLTKKPEIDRSADAKFIALEQKGSFMKSLNTYNQLQNDLTLQKNTDNTKEAKNIKNLNETNTPRSLIKTEREIY